jgi:dihydrofolate reductase
LPGGPAPGNVPEGGVYTFVTDGIEAALKQAQSAAGDQDVTVMGGADTGQQFIKAGLLDELSIHLVPVLFGSGTPMFDHLGHGHLQLENLGAVQTAAATHLRFRVVR